MTAAAERAELAAIGHDLGMLLGDGGARRAQALLGGDMPAPTTRFSDLTDAPVWLRQSRAALEALANRAALVAMGPAIAASIDGAWLGDLARRAGEPALDRAIAAAARVPGGGIPPLPGDAAEALGFDLMRGALASPLHRYLGWAPRGSVPVTAELATFCVAEASA